MLRKIRFFAQPIPVNEQPQHESLDPTVALGLDEVDG